MQAGKYVDLKTCINQNGAYCLNEDRSHPVRRALPLALWAPPSAPASFNPLTQRSSPNWYRTGRAARGPRGLEVAQGMGGTGEQHRAAD